MLLYVWETFSLPAFVTFCIGCYCFYIWFKKPCKNYPPGPRGVPILGYAPFLGRDPEVKFLELAKTYGGIFSLRIGRTEWVILNNADAIHQAFVLNASETADRPPSPFFDKISNNCGVMTLNYGKRFKSQRNFGFTKLRGFGVGKKSMEDRISEDIYFLSETVREKQGKPFDLHHILASAVSNNTSSIVFGRRFEYDDPIFLELMRIIRLTLTDPKSVESFKIITLAPILEHIPPFRWHLTNLLVEIEKEMEIFRKIVKEHEESYDSENLRDFVDAFILEMNKGIDSSFTLLQLVQYLRELFLAGTETTTNTVLWGILCLIHYPETQDKLYQEISDVVGTEGNVSFSKKETMPYTLAFIEELYRFRTLSTLGAPHITSSEITLNGYKLPKGTQILANIWGAHNNPDDWKNPEIFVPQRHLDSFGKFVKSKKVIPFGLGPRRCLGEQLARMEVFIYLVSLVQKFKFEPDLSKADLPEIQKGVQGLGYTPFPFEVIANER